MSKLDKHIKDKMNGMEINPPAHLSHVIKSSKPKPGLKHILSRKSVFIPAGLIVAALSIGLLLNTDNNTSINDSSTAELEKTSKNAAVENKNITPADNNKEKSQNTVADNDNTEKKITDNIYIKTYQSDYKLDPEIKGKWTSNDIPANTLKDKDYTISLSKNKPVEVFKHEASGEKIKYIIERIPKPCIFENEDTSVYNLNCILQADFNQGEWIAENIKISEISKNKFQFQSDSFGNKLIVRKEEDETGVYYDSIRIKFIKPDNDIRIVQKAECYGDNAIVKVSVFPDTDYEIKLSAGEYTKIDNDKYILKNNNSENIICSIINKADNTVIKQLKIKFPEKYQPDYEVTNETCIEKAKIKIKPVDGISSYKLDNTQIPENTSINLSTGKHILTYKDKNNCTYKKEVRVSRNNIINADFDFELSMDKLSARMINKTEFDDDVDEFNFTYKWYHNDELISTEKEPEIQLNSIVNNIELFVSDNNKCKDSAKISELRPDKNLIRVPGFFSPNNDGYFDVFKPVIDERLTKFEAVITNRAGQLIYKWNNPEKGWNGKIHGNQDASPGVYFYTIRAYDTSGNPIEKRGTVQLLRNK